MDRYKTIQDEIRRQHQRSVSTCEIAHVLSMHGLTRWEAPNRQHPRANPCSEANQPLIEAALRRPSIAAALQRRGVGAR